MTADVAAATTTTTMVADAAASAAITPGSGSSSLLSSCSGVVALGNLSGVHWQAYMGTRLCRVPMLLSMLSFYTPQAFFGDN